MMNQEVLKKLQDKRISIIIRDAPRPSGGILTFIGDDYIVVETGKGTKDLPSQVIIAIDQIASILVY